MTHAIRTRILSFCFAVVPTGIVFSLLLLSPLAAFSQTFSFSTHSFTSAVNNSVVLHGDVNNDGYEDLIMSTNSGASRVYLSRGNGSYTALAASISASPSLLGDFNGDGKLDLIAGNHVYFGHGDGTFGSGTVIALLAGSTNIAAADVNHDGKLDLLLLTAPDDSANSELQVLWGNGEGSFTAGPEITISNNFGTTQLLTGDFNGDGNVDVAVATQNEFGNNEAVIDVYSGDGTGNLSVMYEDVNQDQLNLAAADVNGDGISDLVATGVDFNQNAGFIDSILWVYYGQSIGTMRRAQIPLAKFGVEQLAVADFNGDGIPDIAVFETDCDSGLDSCNATPAATLNVLSGSGNGGFAPDVPVSSLQSNPGSPLALRGNRDTKADLVFTNPTTNNTPIITLLNTAAGNFPTCAAPNAAVGIAQCSPAAGVTVNSPVNFAIGVAATETIRKVELWADGKKQFEQFAGAFFSNYGFLNASVPLPAGSHRINIIASGWDNSQISKVSTLNVTASSFCSAPSSAGVHICSPASGSSVSSPVQVQATAKVTGTIASTQLWVDGVKKFTSGSATLTTSISLAAGTHRFAVVATNTAGQKWQSAVNATVK